MALDSIPTGGSSTANQANVDANYNLLVRTPTNKQQSGYAALVSINDAGTITGNVDALAPRTSDDLRLSVGMDTALYDDSFNATAQNTGTWKFTSVSSMLAAQAGGFLTLNSGTQVVTSGALASMQSYRYMTLQGNTALHVEFSVIFGTAITPLAGQVIEFGLFIPPATAIAPADGVFFRYTSGGLNGIMINNGGSEAGMAPGARACVNFAIDTTYHMKMILSEDVVDFYVDNVEIGSLQVPVGYGAPFLSGALPIGMIARNTGTISGTNGTAFKCSDLHVDLIDMDTGKSFAQIFGGMGRHGAQGQNGGTMGGTSNITNNAALAYPGAVAALANATNSGAGCIGIGGITTYLPTLTALTDGILMSYQNPVGGVNQQPRNLIISSIRINSVVSASLTGGPVAMFYYMGYGATALTAATTADTASFTTGQNKCYRRLPIGMEAFAATALIGTGPISGGVNVTLACPITIHPGEFFVIMAKNMGVVTTLGSISSLIGIGSVWE